MSSTSSSISSQVVKHSLCERKGQRAKVFVLKIKPIISDFYKLKETRGVECGRKNLRNLSGEKIYFKDIKLSCDAKRKGFYKLSGSAGKQEGGRLRQNEFADSSYKKYKTSLKTRLLIVEDICS